MKPFFNESDCDVLGNKWVEKDNSNTIQIGCPGISLEKANRLIQERAKVVYGFGTESDPSLFGYDSELISNDTHQALLICVEEIAKDSAEKFVSDFAYELETKVPFYFQKWADRAERLLKGK